MENITLTSRQVISSRFETVVFDSGKEIGRFEHFDTTLHNEINNFTGEFFDTENKMKVYCIDTLNELS